MFGFLVVAFDDFDVRRFQQRPAHRHDGGVVAEQRAQVIRRNDGGAAGEIRPAGERNQRPDQPRTKFFEDENEDEDEKGDGKQRAERRVKNFGEQQTNGVARNDSDERTFHILRLPAFSPAANQPKQNKPAAPPSVSMTTSCTAGVRVGTKI